MVFDLENQLEQSARQYAAPVVGALPASLVMTQRAAAALRAYLVSNGLTHYRIFASTDFDLHDIERHVSRLGETAAWTPMPANIVEGEPVAWHTRDPKNAYAWPVGCLRLAKFDLVLARWYWFDDSGAFTQLWLGAAPSVECFHRLHEQVIQHRHTRGAGVWQVVRGFAHRDGPRTRRETLSAEQLILAPELRKRVDSDIVRFFSDEVAQLYQALNVAYRRGVLLHGPPGNGKTTLIRMIGASLMQIPIFLLRCEAGFDGDDFTEIVRRWTAEAPAMLVIEDLNWLLEKIDVSTFLNTLDGVESQLSGGLMLIATTNHPQELDPAINNRPGRFDVVIEIPPPRQPQRLEFLRQRLGEMVPQTLEKVAAMADGLSFAHLQEILRLSGLLAIAANRKVRADEDLIGAAIKVIESNDCAVRGFPRKPDVPFGFAHLRNRG
jgi:hypothetical protein